MEQGPGEAYRDYTVYDQHYEKVGRVDDLFVDEYDRPEYIGVKMGFLGTKSTLIPIELVRVNDRRRLVEVAAEGEAIKGAPTFEDDRDITPEYEHGVYGYFGLQPPGVEQERGTYGSYYASDPDPYHDEELRGAVDTEYGERSETPEPSIETTYPEAPSDTDPALPLEDTARPEPGVDTAGRGEARGTEEDRQPDVEVQGDRDVRVYKRGSTVR